jgi:stage IV sporulation protein B
MKKVLLGILISILLPINVLAYSNYIIPGGNTLGIEVQSDGIMIIGFYQINGKYNKGNPTLKAGDYIMRVNGNNIDSVKELTKYIEDNIDNNIIITIKRNGLLKNIDLDLIKDGDVYKTGLYVKDSITGIGTLSYIDPETKIFGALGHEVIESNTKFLVEIKTGSIFKNYITGIEKSSRGYAGSKNAKFYYRDKYGKITKNTNNGIFGIYSNDIENINTMEIGDAHIGNAVIRTVLDGETINNYKIDITGIRNNGNKNIVFSIIDEELLNKTGGIVQGMSGSPIIQDEKIVGVVTHVVIDNPQNGYGIFIKTMLVEGEKEKS